MSELNLNTFWGPIEQPREVTLTNRTGVPILKTMEGRVFVRGEETSDVERIGAAFVEWAQVWAEVVP